MIHDTPDVDSPTVRQIRIAFEQTPSKLRLVEQGWRQRRREEIARKQVQQACHGIPKVDHVGHQGHATAIVMMARNPGDPADAMTSRTKPMMAPPTPPPTPPPDFKPVRNGQDHEEDVLKDAPRRIISHPLPPTPTPVVLGQKTTLLIPDQSLPGSYECVLRMGSRRISVMRGGEVMEVVSGNKFLWTCRGECKKWSQAERKQWDTVWDLVEEVKRTTPRVSDCMFRRLTLMSRSRYFIPLP